MAKAAKKKSKGKREPNVEKPVGVTMRLRPVDETPEAGKNIEPMISILAKSEDVALEHVVGCVNVIFGLNALNDALTGKVDKNLKVYYEDIIFRATGVTLMHYEELIKNHNLTVEKILTHMYEDYRGEYTEVKKQNPLVPTKTDQEIMDICAKVLYTVDQIHKKMSEEIRSAIKTPESDKNAVGEGAA